MIDPQLFSILAVATIFVGSYLWLKPKKAD
jgi:hypothetical protein